MKVASLVVAGMAVLAYAGAAEAESGAISVAVDRTAISTVLGHTFTFRTTVTNHRRTAATRLIAHLNVLSLRPGVYVDPEDWSSHRTRYLAPIPAGRSVPVTWKVQAVNSGRIGVYVAAIPPSGAAPPTTSPTVRVSIARRKTLDSGAVLPLALGIPGLLGALTFVTRARRRAA